MGSFSIWHWLIVLFVWLPLLVVPACLIAKKAGYHWSLGILYGIPLIGIVVVWIFACSKWPVSRKTTP